MNVAEVRRRIDEIYNKKLRVIAQFQLQTACRISEAVGKYAVKKEDLKLREYNGHDLALWTLHTAKRNGKDRIVALPFSEDWVTELVDYFQSRKKMVFDYGPSSVKHLLPQEIGDLEYTIEPYRGRESHPRQMNTHALRHVRLTELVNDYGFDMMDLSVFAGWKLKGMAGRYVTSQWGRYIDKMFNKPLS